MTVTKQELINFGYARGLTMGFLLFAASGLLGREDHFQSRLHPHGWGRPFWATMDLFIAGTLAASIHGLSSHGPAGFAP